MIPFLGRNFPLISLTWSLPNVMKWTFSPCLPILATLVSRSIVRRPIGCFFDSLPCPRAVDTGCLSWVRFPSLGSRVGDGDLDTLGDEDGDVDGDLDRGPPVGSWTP
jgi:hypothetical protein